MSLFITKLWIIDYVYPFILLFQMNAYIVYLDVFFNFYWNHFLTLINNNHNYYDCNRIPYFVFNDIQLTFIGMMKLSFPFYDYYINNPYELNVILNELI